ncbi:MAG: sulfite exporter TauE/SafE family protein [Hyphomicrobium sp.]
MMDLLGIALSGLILGAAGSLHCGAMCGCIASGALFVLAPSSRRERAAALAKMHAGRIAFYSLLGAASAGSISLVFGPSATELQFRSLQSASAAIVMWIGLAMAGVMPRFAVADRIVDRTTELFGRCAGHGFRSGKASPWIMGALWGSAPCPLVYAAALSASLTGSAFSGALFMAAYGAGTLPSVTLTALGLVSLRSIRANPIVHAGAGLSVAVFGLVIALSDAPLGAAFCTTR